MQRKLPRQGKKITAISFFVLSLPQFSLEILQALFLMQQQQQQLQQQQQQQQLSLRVIQKATKQAICPQAAWYFLSMVPLFANWEQPTRRLQQPRLKGSSKTKSLLVFRMFAHSAFKQHLSLPFNKLALHL